MEQSSAESVTSDLSDEGDTVRAALLNLENCFFSYVQQNSKSTNTQLFSLLALLNAYIPESYLLMDECQRILGPPDPIHGGPPFRERMEPFTIFIETSGPIPEGVSVCHPVIAQRAVELFADFEITRSNTMKNLMSLLRGAKTEPHITQFIKDLLTKREMGENGKERFSRLISDILVQESNLYNAVSVLKSASYKFRKNAIFPQTIARLYHIYTKQTKRAEKWARKAIKRAPKNSYMADTLGQVYKKRLIEDSEDIFKKAKAAFKSFKDVMLKAEEEEDPENTDTTDADSTSDSFNNRGHFGFIQVAKVAFEKLGQKPCETLYPNIKMEVEEKFVFFEWYLTYSKLDMRTLEPYYFWKDVALCYKYYTTKTAAESTSFPGLLDFLNHGLFMSKGRRANFDVPEKTAADLETIRDDLAAMFEQRADDVEVAERYILSNILLSNKMPNSPQLAPMNVLRTIMKRFLGTTEVQRKPEFYLLSLLLFWPEERLQLLKEEDDKEMATEDRGTTGTTWKDKEQDPGGEPAQLSPDLMFDPDLQQHVTLMEKAFEGVFYAKYLRGRYLLPLFFLGKGSGLSKWIHKSRLDAIVEEEVDTKLSDKRNNKEKERQISHMWLSGKVWHIARIKDILLPLQTEPGSSAVSPEHEEQDVFVCAGGKKIKARTEVQPPGSVLHPALFYLGFTIQGPVVFRVGDLDTDKDSQ